MGAGATNPLLQSWDDAPHGLPPFDRLRPEHFKPAFEQALKQHREEVEAIASQAQSPSFDNTVAAFDRAGRWFKRLEALFYNLSSSETSPALQGVERELAAPLAAHSNAIHMHAGLFRRLDALHAQRDRLALTPEQRRLLERFHLDFVRSGARLAPAAQARYAQVTERLAELTTRFAQNVLHDEAAHTLVLHSPDELAGLPDFVRTAARQAAIERGLPEAWVITLARSHIVPFLTFSERRDLRERAYAAWTTRGEHEGEHDNRPVAREILALRAEQARLLGYACYADYALADTMAGSADAANDLLMKVWGSAKLAVERERAALQALQHERGQTLQIEAWDWRYLAEKLRQQRHALDEAQIKAYLPLPRVVQAAFDAAERLFGVRLVEQPDARVYHPEVKVYEVRDAADALLGLFLHDNFARPTKRSGAWMSAYRWQTRNGGAVTPIVVNNNNFAKGAPGEPTLLGVDDARTLFHEFGHALHALLSDVGYERLSGTHVLWDFVELPSQLFEHWLIEPAMLKQHARHHRTGEAMPDDLIARLQAARHFNEGYETVRYCASALVDMAIHRQPGPDVPEIVDFESAELARLGMPPGIGMNHRLPHFQHLFSGASYAAGYYVYLWADVLAADGFEAFVEAGDAFDAATAERLRRCVYAVGNAVDPGQAYAAFRGRPPRVEPMLRERGMLDSDAVVQA